MFPNVKVKKPRKNTIGLEKKLVLKLLPNESLHWIEDGLLIYDQLILSLLKQFVEQQLDAKNFEGHGWKRKDETSLKML